MKARYIGEIALNMVTVAVSVIIFPFFFLYHVFLWLVRREKKSAKKAGGVE